MDRHHPPNDPTPDQQRAARDKKWAKAASMHWRAYAPFDANRPRTRTRTRTDDQERARNAKPNDIPSQPPGGQGDQLPS